LQSPLGAAFSSLPSLQALTLSSPDSGAGYTFGAQVVKKFLEINDMVHILRAHQLCMEGFSVLYDDRLSTVWSAPNYCYRCGNMASILEIGPGGEKHFNVFDAAPENERDGPTQQVPQTGPQNVSWFLGRTDLQLTSSFSRLQQIEYFL
jgi:serine/threonine-protein phosphatase PPG1